MKLAWDKVGERFYETGADHGVLFQIDNDGNYGEGVVWNGLTTVTESPSGAEASPQWADNIKYLNLTSAEQWGGTIEALTYPKEFAQNDGSAEPVPGVQIGQQNRRPFGFCYRTQLGNDVHGTDLGYKLHLVYGAQAAPSEKAHATVSDTPAPTTFSWTITTTPVAVGEYEGVVYKPTATLTIDSTTTDPTKLAALETVLYGDDTNDPEMPLPMDVLLMVGTTLTVVTPTEPTYDSGTHVITIPSTTGVIYKIKGVVKTGTVTITEDTVVTASPAAGYKFPAVHDNDWFFAFS